MLIVPQVHRAAESRAHIGAGTVAHAISSSHFRSRDTIAAAAARYQHWTACHNHALTLQHPKWRQIQIYRSVFQGVLLDWWDSIATFPGANFMGGCRSSQRLIPIPPSPYLSLSNQGIVLLPILSLPFSTCPTCSTSLTCSLGLIRNSYSLPGNVVY